MDPPKGIAREPTPGAGASRTAESTFLAQGHCVSDPVKKGEIPFALAAPPRTDSAFVR